MKILRRLHLEARNLRRERAALADLERRLRERNADVAADARLVLAVFRREQAA